MSDAPTLGRAETFRAERFQNKTLIEFLPYQKDWLGDDARFKIGMMSRQAGKSFGSGAELVDDVIQHEARGEKTQWVVLSRGERQAVHFMNATVKPMLKAFYILYKAILKNAQPPEIVETEYSFEREVDGKTVQVSYKAAEVVLPNGSRITALPANPDTARGFSANVLLDEFAFHANSRDIWKALFPCITRGYKIRVISTPNGKSNKFYDLMTAEDETWSKHKVTIWDAVEQGLDVDPYELKAGLGDDDAWLQEYELEWTDGDAPALLWDDIVSCEEDGAGDPSGFTGGPTFGGEDIAGKGNDLWVMSVFEELEGRLWNREDRESKTASFAEQDRQRDELFDRYRILRHGMDETGLGAKPVEDAIIEHGASAIEGVVFTNASKHDLVQALQKSFQDRRMAIRKGDKALRADLHAVKKKVSSGGLVTYSAPRTADGHSDRFWAYALANWVARGGVAIYAYHSASRGESSSRDTARRRVRTSSGLRAMRGAY